MASNKQLVLITGANVGIGFELAAQLLADASVHVLLGARSPEKGAAAVKELQSRSLPGTVELLEVDISKDDSIFAAAKAVETKFGRLDALVNNAGIARASGSESEQMAEVYRTNVIGTHVMTEAFVPLLRKSNTTPRIIHVSSAQGSLAMRQDTTTVGYKIQGTKYRASKSALNMVMLCHVYEYKDENIKIFAYCPGFTVSELSELNREANGAHPTVNGAEPIVAFVRGDKDAQHGKFINFEGVEHPW